MSKLLEMLKKLFHTPTALEQYVSSKRPSSNAEIDFWIRQYDYKRFGSLQ
jgi:hypothetical protein